ncbi:MAG TPA: DUF2147 domain-containing protein [Flavobacteriaceae bacterium]|nr:DUF2147 domain-containing protein [Flavobacteriaceae bacterium]HEX5743276.1 DUF2147 domain-containing protein [Flavobacteriaceae bacterium]
MKKLFVSLLMFAVIGTMSIAAQTVFGKWKTIDDETGLEKSIVEIYQKDGKVYGKVLQVLEKGKENKVCDECKGDKKNKPVKGMIIVDGLKKDGDEYSGGTILDPKNGKIYKCYITLEEVNKLKVRGFIGFALIGRTQYWHRVTE